ncbi:MAG: hypothetical protein ACREP7_18570 [Lysobacter sp.]
MFEDFWGGGIVMMFFAIVLKFFARANSSTFNSLADSHDSVGDQTKANELRDTAASYSKRVDRYFYPLLIAGLAMIALTLIGRLWP